MIFQNLKTRSKSDNPEAKAPGLPQSWLASMTAPPNYLNPIIGGAGQPLVDPIKDFD